MCRKLIAYTGGAGKVIARLLPPEDERQNARHRLAELRASSRIDDVISSVNEEWEVDRVDP